MNISKTAKILMTGAAASALMTGSSMAEENHGDHASSHYPAHIVGIFTGITDGDTSDFTFGAEYEFRINEMFGVGGVVEYTSAAHHDDGVTVALAAVHVHPYGGLRLTGGIGKEWIGGEHPHSDTLYRLGAAYDIEIGNFGLAIAPTFNVDFVGSHETYVYGLVLSKHF